MYTEKLKQFLALFPLKGQLTEQIINNADVYNTDDCRGARTLTAALGDNISLIYGKVKWGDTFGGCTVDGANIFLSTEMNTNFMEAKEPQTVIFVVDKIETD